MSYRGCGLFVAVAFLSCFSVSANAGFLYTLNDGGSGSANRIYAYSVNETTGALTALAGSPISTGGNGSGQSSSEFLTIDRTNRRLYVVNDGSDTVSAYSISGVTGALTALPFSPFALPAGDYETIAVHPSGSPLIIGDNSGARSASYVITATTATAAAGSPFTTSPAIPNSSVFSRTGTYFYTGGNADNTVAGFSVNATTGVLTPLAGSPFSSGNAPFAYATDAAGRLFLANNIAQQVRAFTTASGIPSAATNSPFTTNLTSVTDGTLAPNDNFYAVADTIGNTVGIYQIAGSGAATTLTAVAGSPVSANGTNTRSVVFNTAGTFLYASNLSSRNISIFTFNSTTGATVFSSVLAANTAGTTGSLQGIDYLASTPVAATTTSVSSSVDPSVFGQSVTFTATVSTAGLGTPTGNVQFFDGANPIGSAIALNGSGQAQLATTSLSVGGHTITAQYAGDVPNGFNSSNGSLSTNPQTVNQASTTTGISSNQSNPVGTGIPVTYTATVSPVAPGAGTRTGTVTFRRNGSPVCTNVAVNGSAQATCALTFTIAGNYNITAAYSGDTNFTASTSSTFVQQVVGPTAANIQIAGRVVTSTGRGVSLTSVSLTGSNGETRYAITNTFGYYRFSEVSAGETYFLTYKAMGYETVSSNINALHSVTDLIIVLTR